MLAPKRGYKYGREFKSISAPPFRRRAGGGPRDVEQHADIEALMHVVGSKNARDITRKNHFMSKAAFDTWNAKQPKGKYWADYYDVDEDGTDEFIVRGKDKDGPLVAINGYTTKKSDWPIRRAYYDTYPEIGSRPDGGITEFAREYHNEEYDQYGYPTKAYLQRIADMQDQYKKYNIRGGGSTSPYNVFVKRIVADAIQQEKSELQVDDDGWSTISAAIAKHEGKGWLLKLAGQKWTDWVKIPIIADLEKAGALEGWRNLYYQTHARSNSAELDKEKFEKWLFNKKEIKAEVKDFIKFMFDKSSDEYNLAVDAFTYEIDQLVQAAIGSEGGSPSTSPSKQRYLAKYGAE